MRNITPPPMLYPKVESWKLSTSAAVKATLVRTIPTPAVAYGRIGPAGMDTSRLPISVRTLFDESAELLPKKSGA